MEIHMLLMWIIITTVISVIACDCTQPGVHAYAALQRDPVRRVTGHVRTL